jgi:gluconolactonase
MNVMGIPIVVYESKGAAFANIKVEKVASGFQFTEGPVWHPDQYLLFSDIPANKIVQLFRDGRTAVYMENSGFIGNDYSLLSDQPGSNGLAIDTQLNLIICQHGNHAIAMVDKDNVTSVLTSAYQGRPYNSPNDIVVRYDGSIYFSDPPYGLKDQVHNPSVFQPVAGVYRYKDGDVELISDLLKYPNGVCLSPDDSYLYVSSNHNDEACLYRYRLTSDGSTKERSLVIEQNADGIKTDREGRLFLCTDEGILIISAEGKKLALIPLPETPANIAWVKPGFSELYITARSSIYRASGF